MSRLARRYWTSLTDADVDSLDQLIERGRQRDGALWRRYLASLLDVPATGEALKASGEAVKETKQAERDPPTSRVSHVFESTVNVGTTPPARSLRRRSIGFALAALLVIATAFGASRLLSAPRWIVTPAAPPSAPPVTGGVVPPIPAGYHTVRDPVGYTVAIPLGWTRSQKQGVTTAVVYYKSPDGSRQLQIFGLSESTPAESLDLAENDSSHGYAQQPGYQALDRASGDTWSELSYRYDDVDKGPSQVIDHRFTARDGRLYAIRASGPGSPTSALIRDLLNTAIATFCPEGSSCS
ncbi:hypothetical protein [Streptomyces sp. NPDC056660]|uniref:hypothetical protein n=1 Tax=Streptomyces sp. NPDC056660 TaxID=3345897 RepID=UPI003675EF51